jgi:hypothetical protein
MRRLTLDEFVLKSRKIHGEKYDYSRTKIANATTKVVIICPKHGPFEQEPYVHYGQGCGCPPCAGKRALTLSDMQRLAKQKGGACLAEEYVMEFWRGTAGK